MLGELFGVVGTCTPLKDNTVASTYHPELANSRPQSSLQVRFKMDFLFIGLVIFGCHLALRPCSPWKILGPHRRRDASHFTFDAFKTMLSFRPLLTPRILLWLRGRCCLQVGDTDVVPSRGFWLLDRARVETPRRPCLS
jgi:hypothetical protein